MNILTYIVLSICQKICLPDGGVLDICVCRFVRYYDKLNKYNIIEGDNRCFPLSFMGTEINKRQSV